MAIYKSHISETMWLVAIQAVKDFPDSEPRGLLRVSKKEGVGGVSKAVKVTQGSSKVRPWESI